MRKQLAFVRLSVVAIGIALGGCVSGSQPISKEKLASIHQGTTTEADLVRLFGEPQARTASSDGTQYLTWTHADLTNTAVAAVFPLISNVPHTQGLTVKLAPDGTVRSYNTSEGNSTNLRFGQ